MIQFLKDMFDKHNPFLSAEQLELLDEITSTFAEGKHVMHRKTGTGYTVRDVVDGYALLQDAQSRWAVVDLHAPSGGTRLDLLDTWAPCPTPVPASRRDPELACG